MANAFNDFFTKVGPNLVNDIPKKTRIPTKFLNIAKDDISVISVRYAIRPLKKGFSQKRIKVPK